jgi:hypothetical protein
MSSPVPRRHAAFCDIEPGQRGHGVYCVSRPVARQAVASSEPGQAVAVTVDLAVLWSKLDGPRMVRVVSTPPNADRQSVAVLASGTARQLATALLAAANQAEEVLRDVTRQRVS